MNLTMKQLPQDAQPYEKCMRYGPEFLTDTELLAVVLRIGRQGSNSLELADELMRSTSLAKQGSKEMDDSAERLVRVLHMSMAELVTHDGIGKVKAVQIQCIGELARRVSRQEARRALDVNDPSSVYDYYRETLRYEEQEVVICMMLDSRNRLIGESELTRGTVNMSLISAREVFMTALSAHASKIILIHNHPSGDASPSSADIETTRRIFLAGEMLGIPLLDHIIAGDNTYTSLYACGVLQTPDPDDPVFRQMWEEASV